jgi:hypothetical protein
MLACTQKIHDVFVTRDSREYRSSVDYTFLGPVWSVDIREPGEATVVNKATPWVTWCKSMDTDPNLEVGDTVRIGTPGTDGFTGMCTILQRTHISRLSNSVTSNGTYSDVVLRPSTTLSKGSTQNDQLTAGPHVAVSTYAYRLNSHFNLTYWTDANPIELAHIANAFTREQQTLRQRHLLRHSIGAVTNTDEQLYMPLYKQLQWPTENGEVQVNLGNGVRRVNWIKLIGYSVFDKQQAGFQSAHEFKNDDWIALQLKGVTGNVVSNNAYAHGSFAILHVGSARDSQSGAIDYHTHDTDGLCKLEFDGGAHREISVRLVDRSGAPAHFGRIHLWFRVCVDQS